MATISIAGTYYAFTVTAANATVGATYTNNGFTYTVKATIAGDTNLYTTAAAAGNNPTTSGTLTKTGGTGDATITFSAWLLDANLSNVTYAAGDVIATSANQRLIIDSSTSAKKPAGVQALNGSGATIFVTNTSNTTPIVVELNAIGNSFSILNDCTFKVRGDWIPIYTGTGAAFQQIDFNTAVGGVLIDYPPFVMVETGNATNVWEPFLNLAKGTYDFTVSGVTVTPTIGATYTNNAITFRVWRTNITAGAGTIYCTATTGTPVIGNLVKVSGTGDATIAFSAFTAPDVGGIDIATNTGSTVQLGRFFNFDNVSKIATFGDGTNGYAIPNGARVRYPNIHFTSAKTSTVTLRSFIATNSGGNLDFQCCAWSNAWYLTSSTMYEQGAQTLVDVGFSMGWLATYVQLDLNINGLYVSADPDSSAYTAISIGNCLGSTTLNGLYSVLSKGGTNAINVGVVLKFLGGSNWNGYIISRTVANLAAITLTYIYSAVGNTTISGVCVVGGNLNVGTTKNLRINNVTHSDTANGITNSVLIDQGVNINSGCSNVIVHNIRKLASGSACYSHIAQILSGTDRCVIHDVIYDSAGQSSSISAPAGERTWVANMYSASPARSTNLQGFTWNKWKGRASNIITGGTPIGNSPTNAGFHTEYCSVVGALTVDNSSPDIPPFQALVTNSAKTLGVFQMGPFAIDLLASHVTVVSGTPGVDFTQQKIGYLNLTNSGIELQVNNDFVFPIRGISSFSGATINTPGVSATTGVTYEFKMRNARDRYYTMGWTTVSAANLQTALAGLTGYTTSLGFQISLRITTQSTLAGRQIQRIYFTGVTMDSAFTPSEVGFIEVGVSGAVTGSVMSVFDNTVPASPVWIEYDTIPASGTYLADFPYGFAGGLAKYLVRLRSYAYEPIEASGACYQTGATVPVSQIAAHVVASPAVASAYTGIAISFSDTVGTVTLTQNHSMQEIFDYCRYQLALPDNLDYQNFINKDSSENYTPGSVAYALILNRGNITGSGTLNLGSKNLTITAGETSSVPITAANGKTAVFTLTGLSAATVYLMNDSNVKQDYQSSVTGTYTFYIPNTATGIWTWVTKKTGYKGAFGTFTATSGGNISSAPSMPQEFQPSGTAMYQGTSDANVTVTFNGSTYAYIVIGNATVGVQATYDTVERALITQNGMAWLAGAKADTSIAALIAGNFLFMTAGWRLKALAAGQLNTAIGAFVFSTDGIAVADGSAGSDTSLSPVAYLSSSQLTSQQVRDAMTLAVTVGVTPAGGSIDAQLALLPALL